MSRIFGSLTSFGNKSEYKINNINILRPLMNFEKDDLDKTITKGRKGIIKFCKKLLVGKTHKEIVLITDSCNKYPFTVF